MRLLCVGTMVALLMTVCSITLLLSVSSMLSLIVSGNLMLVTLIIPPVAIVLGAWVLGEELKPQAYAGFALLAAGLVILNGKPLLRRKRARN